MSISKELLEELYNEQFLSIAAVAARLGCSSTKVVYWMNKHGIPRRDISEAVYRWRNPDGDPFDVRTLETEQEHELFLLAIGLYVGEGKKHSDADVSLSNTDPRVIQVFLRFLREICGVEEAKIWAWINLFEDADLAQAQAYWAKVTGLTDSQFYKAVVRPRRGGTYSRLSKYGTLTVGVSNTRLRQIVLGWCAEYLDKYS